VPELDASSARASDADEDIDRTAAAQEAAGDVVTAAREDAAG
jgi:hypothetical protein